MSSSRRLFLKQLGLGAGGLVFLSSHGLLAKETIAGFPRSTPEAEGVSSSGILAFLEELQNTKHEFHGLVIARHGKVIAEGWWAPYAPTLRHTLYSMSKSFTSSAVGFAVAEGKLKVDDLVLSFFPEDRPAEVSANLQALRIRDLLTMSVGSDKEPTHDMVKEENWVRHFLGHSITHAPGSVFLYNSAATYMCSAIVQKVTGQKVIDYLTPRLFEPLGIEGATWETCPRGINTGGWGLSVPTEALARFGQLYLQKGQWNGRQILPQKWVEEATAFHIQQPSPEKPARPAETNDWLQGYGYQFWRCTHGGYRGDGAFGQFTIVLPEQDVVIAIQSESPNMQGQLDLVWQHLAPAFTSDPLPAEPVRQERLRRMLTSLALPLPPGKKTSPTSASINAKTFQLEKNELGLENVAFTFDENGVATTWHAAGVEHTIRCGFGQWQSGETALPGTPVRLISGGAPPAGTLHPVTSAGGWTDDQTLRLKWRYIESPHHDNVVCRFDGDQVQITFTNSIAAMAGKSKDERPVLQGKLTA